jgi:uncharacterized protein with HEPN domain
MAHDDLVRLRHMLEAAEIAFHSAQDRSRTDLDEDPVWMWGLVKCIEIVGEAANHVSAATQTEYPQIPWPLIVGMRNRLVHVYFDLDRDRLWDTLTVDLPMLITELKKIVDRE